jgi:hypothetical protein
MVNLNFDNVTAAAEKIMTPPGTIDVFKISKVEFGSSKNKQTGFMKLTFENKDSSFNHSFYFSEKALPRIQSLAEALGSKLAGAMTDESLTARFLNKEIGLKVTGQVSDQGKGYPNLSFGGFCKPKTEVQFLAFNSKEKEEIEAAKSAMARNSSNTADQEEANMETAGAGTGEKW